MPHKTRALLPLALTALAVAALIALGWASRQPTGVGDGANTAADAPQWAPGDDAPRYLLRLDPDSGPTLLDAQRAPIAALNLRWRADYGEPEGDAGCAADNTCTHQEEATLTGWTALQEPSGAILLTGSHQGRFARVEATWRANPGDPALALEVTVHHEAEAWPDREALTFTLHDDAAAMGRDLRFVSVNAGQRHLIDRWTPRRVIAGQGDRALHLLAGDWGSALITGLPSGADLTLEWEDARNHPFRPLARCQEDPTARSARDREPHQGAYTRRATLQLGHTWMPWPGRAPEGRPAALALLDATPATTPEQLRALLQGHSDEADGRFGNGGLLGHNLRLTRALYAGSAGLGNRPLADLVQRARELGLRVANHSATADQDPLDLNEAGMIPMSAHKATTWIDAFNGCADFHGDGWRAESGGLPDLLARNNYQYLWSGITPQPAPGSLNLLRPQDRDARPAILWPNRRSGHLFHLFAAMNLEVSRARLAPLFQREALQRLADERGLLLARTSLGTTRSPGSLSDDGLLRRDDKGHYLPTGDLEGILSELERAQGRGDLWITTVEDLLTRLRALDALSIAPLPDGRLLLHNRSDAPLDGLTLHLPGGHYKLIPEGAQLSGSRAQGEGAQAETLAWLELPARGELVLQVLDAAGTPLSPLIPVQWILEGESSPEKP